MKHLLLISCLWHIVTGSLKVISMEKQSAAVGLSATLQCQLIANTKPDVLQVSWQKESGSNIGPVATCSKSFGKKYIGYYSNRIADFTEITPDVSAITIQSVNLEDQGCFKCIFNVFPFGANYAKICLDVYEMNITEPTLDSYVLTSSNSSEEFCIVSCSVTGKPAPSMRWNIPEEWDDMTYIYTIVNPDQSVTVISNFTISKQQQKRNVTCVINHPSLRESILLTKSITYTREENTSVGEWLWICVVLAIVFVTAVLLLTLCLYKRIKRENYENCDEPGESSLEIIKEREYDGSALSKHPILHFPV